jgi:hypothetical protein
MASTTHKVGDVVAWADVPDGALVRDKTSNYALRRDDLRPVGGGMAWPAGHGAGAWVRAAGRPWRGFEAPFPWSTVWRRDSEVTIVALGLTGQESAADLQRLAEVFDAAQALEGCLVAGTPEGDVYCAVLKGPETPENWPLEWFVNERDGLVRLVVGTGDCEATAREDARQNMLAAPTWRPGMALREAERALFPGTACALRTAGEADG